MISRRRRGRRGGRRRSGRLCQRLAVDLVCRVDLSPGSAPGSRAGLARGRGVRSAPASITACPGFVGARLRHLRADLAHHLRRVGVIVMADQRGGKIGNVIDPDAELFDQLAVAGRSRDRASRGGGRPGGPPKPARRGRPWRHRPRNARDRAARSAAGTPRGRCPAPPA